MLFTFCFCAQFGIFFLLLWFPFFQISKHTNYHLLFLIRFLSTNYIVLKTNYFTIAYYTTKSRQIYKIISYKNQSLKLFFYKIVLNRWTGGKGIYPLVHPFTNTSK